MSKIVEAKNISYCYPEDYWVFKNLNFSIIEGEFFGVLGKNGAGKTTLLEMLVGYKESTGGDLIVQGQKFPLEPKENRKPASFISYDNSIYGGFTVKEFFEFYRSFYQVYDVNKEKNLLEYFELEPSKLIGSLSTGQQKKAQIIAGLSSNSKLLIIDEITAVLDPESRKKFFNLLTEEKKLNKTIILATNIAEDIINIADKALYLKEDSFTVLNSPSLKEMFK